MLEKKYDAALIERVTKLREGLGKQPLAQLRHMDETLWEDGAKVRRILSRRVFPGDLPYVERLEAARAKWRKAMGK